jgi:hypothetical protein
MNAEAIARLRRRITEVLDDAGCSLEAADYKQFVELIGTDVMQRQYDATVAVVKGSLQAKVRRKAKRVW